MATPDFSSTGVSSKVRLGLEDIRSPSAWGLEQVAGRLVEISAHRAAATLTAAFGLVREAQEKEEPVAWVTLRKSTFFPPDVADSGIELSGLVVVRVAETRSSLRAAVELTRSGGFGLVVVDLGPEPLEAQKKDERRTGAPGRGSRKPATPLVTKLVGLAQQRATAVVLLTDKTSRTSSVSSLVSLRAEARHDPDAPGEVKIMVLKDKRRGPGRCHREVCRVPAGLR